MRLGSMSYPTGYLSNKELKSMTVECLKYEQREAEMLADTYESDGWRNYARNTRDNIERIEKEVQRRKQEGSDE